MLKVYLFSSKLFLDNHLDSIIYPQASIKKMNTGSKYHCKQSTFRSEEREASSVNRAAHLKPISTGTRKHLVDAEHVEWVGTYAHVEVVLSGVLGHVFVGRHSGSLQGLRRQLLLLVGYLILMQIWST